MYRSPKAHNVHTAILSYLHDNDASPLNKTHVKYAIKALDEASLLELSLHGYSHLNDILHLSFEIAPHNAGRKCSFLMQRLLCKANSLGSRCITKLLLQESHDGFTPLHQVLNAGTPENLKIYLGEVRHAVTNQWMERNDYIDLLINPNKAGFTPLHDVLKGGNPENVKIYLNEIRHAVTNQWMEKNDYIHLLIKPTNAGFTPLHDVVKAGNPENVKLYLDELDHAVINQGMKKNDYINLLIQPTNSGLTPLHQAANSNSVNTLVFFLNELKKLPMHIYSQALFAKTDEGFIPSCQKAKSNANEINTFLKQERKNNIKPTPQNPGYTPQRFFKYKKQEHDFYQNNRFEFCPKLKQQNNCL
ncbi:ankyrin repeat domain-containing protein [Legionella sainthelensi]|uniref:ankyrin repeat domain-containing protein n=1 Tax=Legionella sainthelensi TaxID=28087 RepID=UPI000E20702A|nr:ankyrin repeat domain-containing protein [Legionella sainthelensi]